MLGDDYLKELNVKRNSIIVLLLTIFVIFLLLRNDFNEVLEDVLNTNYLLLFLAICVYIISYLFDALSYYFIVKQYKDDYTIPKALRLNILTHFFNGITPLASGGQPMQLYILHKDKVKMSDASTCVIQFYIIYQIGLVVVGSVCLAYSIPLHYIEANPVAMSMFVIGFLINIGILLFLLFISFNRNFNKAVVNFIINILCKIGIVKDKEKTKDKWNQNCDGFYESAQLMKKNIKTIFNCVLLQILQILFLLSVPFFVCLATGVNHSLNIFSSIAIASFITICSCYVPIPGATGGVEYGFLSFFNKFIRESIRVTLIIWRFITYFLPVIIGGIVFNVKKKT